MKNIKLQIKLLCTIIFLLGFIVLPQFAMAQKEEVPFYLRDRGTGVSISMFGTYMNKGEIIVYPFFEYYLDSDMEYAPFELGYGLDKDFRGKYRASEGLIFLGYGLTDRVALEFEAAVITATLETASDDPTNIPDRIKESGLGDIEGQVRWRWKDENERSPELFSYFETCFPFQKDKILIGTQDWEFKLGTGITKGFSLGTFTFRLAVEYSMEESKFEVGEYAFEYLKRLSLNWLMYLGVEGSEDEVELIPMAQWDITDSIALRLNSAFGITSKATDWAPEVGIMFWF